MKFQIKAVSLLSISVVLSVGITCIFIYFASKRLLCDYLGVQAKVIAERVASTIDTAAVEAVIQKTISSESPVPVLSMPEYRSLRNHLNTCRKAAGIKYLYIVTKNTSDKTVYVVDGFPLDYKGRDLSLPGDVEHQYYAGLENTFKTKKITLDQLTVDSMWGATVSAFMPFNNARGQCIGVIGADIDGVPLVAYLSKSVRLLIILALLGFFTALIIVYHISKMLIDPLNTLIRKISRYNRGDHSVILKTETKDEVGALSRACDEMIMTFNENLGLIDTTLKALTQARSCKELGQILVKELKNVTPFETIAIVESNGTTIRFPLEPERQPPQALTAFIMKSFLQHRIGELIPLDSGCILLMGRAQGSYFYLWLNGYPAQINIKERFLLQFISCYSSICYENLNLIDELSGNIVDLKIKNNDSSMMSKLLFSVSEKERKRLASDLHDYVLQEIIKIKRAIGSFMDTECPVEPEVQRFLKNTENELLSITRQIRLTCHELAPMFLLEKGLDVTINELIENTRLRSNIEFSFESFTDVMSLDYEESLTVYRVVQELITNAVKHSKATKVDLMLRQDNGVCILYYSDNGIGMDFNAEQNVSHHFGLLSIRERVKIMNGKTSYRSESGNGLEISCQFPLKKSLIVPVH